MKRSQFIIPLVVLLASFLLPAPLVPPSFAQGNPACGGTITTSTTLTADIGPCSGKGLTIGASNITLDCAGHTVTASGPGISTEPERIGILLSGVSGVTVKNCQVATFKIGIELVFASGNTLTDNTSSNNACPSDIPPPQGGCGGWGFGLFSSNGNTLRGNTAFNNVHGFVLLFSNNNRLTQNFANNPPGGIVAFTGFTVQDASSSNTLSENTAINVGVGFFLGFVAHNNLLTQNTATNNSAAGFAVQLCCDIGAGTAPPSGNTLAENKATTVGGFIGSFGFLDETSGLNTFRENTCSGTFIAPSSPPGLCTL